MASVLVACEYSGAVRSRLRRMGLDAVSCDILPAEDGSAQHIQGDAITAMQSRRWDAIIAFPPCTYLTVSGNRWFYHPDDKHLPVSARRPHPRHPDRQQKRLEAVRFFMSFVNCGAAYVAIENPIGIMSTYFRKPDQIVQPWQYGHGETKSTCFWLKGLPLLEATDVVDGRDQRIWKMPPGKDRAKERSRTYSGIAEAIATQWGSVILEAGK